MKSTQNPDLSQPDMMKCKPGNRRFGTMPLQVPKNGAFAPRKSAIFRHFSTASRMAREGIGRRRGVSIFQMLVQKLERPFAVDRVWAVEDLDGAAVADTELGVVQIEDLGIFISHRLV
jgi:hypothetical protein